MVTWSLENAIDTADSMKSRGYGFPGRTAFSIYRFTDRDKAALLWLFACGFFVLSGSLTGGMKWRYYPTVTGTLTGVLPIGFQLAYLALCMTPMILNRWEDRKWKSLESKI